MSKRTYALIILDGWGIGEKNHYNAIHMAKTPFLDKLSEKYPSTQLACSGKPVGLPDGIMGNSEVGHLNIGAGRIVYQDLLRIDRAIKDKSLNENLNLQTAFEKVLANKSSLHLMGLLSDGGVHSQITHLYALLDLAKKRNINKVVIHVILDGRDTPTDKGVEYVAQLQSYLKQIKCGSISTICGRYYAMDRDKRWNRIEKAYNLYTEGIGKIETNPIKAIKQAYLRNETDEFIKPIIIINPEKKTKHFLKNNDVVIFFNFRADRAREISSAFTDPDFSHFKRKSVPKLSEYLTMTLYDKSSNTPNIFPSLKMSNLLGEVISKNKLKQVRIAETEKYAHVTYFFNGGDESPFANEDRFLIQSPRNVRTYDEKPEMSARALTEKTINLIETNTYDFLVINFANMDMVGHTGILDAAIKACETVDDCIKKIVAKILALDGIAIITADHGNSEKMATPEGKPFTSHTKNKVPLLIVDNNKLNNKFLLPGALCDIAPTILSLMKIKKPAAMSGKSLLSD